MASSALSKICLLSFCLALTFFIVSCDENEADRDLENSSVNTPGYVADSTTTTALAILPESGTIRDITRSYRIQFKAIGGTPPYTWTSSNRDLGSINGNGLYTSKPLITGVNVIIVTDARGKADTAEVTQEVEAASGTNLNNNTSGNTTNSLSGATIHPRRSVSPGDHEPLTSPT